MNPLQRQGRSAATVTALALALLALALLPASVFATGESELAYVSPATPTNTGHGDGTATALPGGNVLVAGGWSHYGHEGLPGNWKSRKAEIYDPTSGLFTMLANEMTAPHTGGASSQIGDGTVLIVGGKGGQGGWEEATSAADIYDPGTGGFTATGSLRVPRAGLFAAPLPDGTVLVGGGACSECGGVGRTRIWGSTEIYDPVTGEFCPGPSMLTARTGASAVSLPDGRVIVMGGRNDDEGLSSTEIFDPATGRFEPGPPYPGGSPTGNFLLGATLLSNGRVLVVGLEFFEFDPVSEEFIRIEDRPDSNPYYEVAVAPLPGGGALLAATASSVPAPGKAWIYTRDPFPRGHAIDFGQVPVGGASAPQTLTVANRLALDLEIGGASLSGPDAGAFTIVGDGCSGKTLALGEACELEVSASPTQAGPLTAAIQLDDSAFVDFPVNYAFFGSHDYGLTVEGIVQPPISASAGGSATTTAVSPVSAKAKKPKKTRKSKKACRKATKHSHGRRCGKPG